VEDVELARRWRVVPVFEERVGLVGGGVGLNRLRAMI
jgi:hypothetical protein